MLDGPPVTDAASGVSSARAIELIGVTVQFGDIVALNSVSMAARFGTITGLVGHNGAGKSTIMHLVAGVLLPDAGTARMFGLDPADSAEGRGVRRRAGFLLEEEALFDYLTGREFLEFIGQAFELRTDEVHRRIADLSSFFVLRDDMDRVIDEYSTGMRKKLAIAAAMLPGPAMLVLDEPFESIDPAMVRRLSTALRAFAARGGTVLLSSHLLHAVQRVCDRVVFLDRGRVVAERRIDGRSAEGRSDEQYVSDLSDTYAEVISDSAPEVPEWLGEDTVADR